VFTYGVVITIVSTGMVLLKTMATPICVSVCVSALRMLHKPTYIDMHQFGNVVNDSWMGFVFVANVNHQAITVYLSYCWCLCSEYLVVFDR
jgi:hypothetical protein